MLDYKQIIVPVDFARISYSAISRAAIHSEVSNSELLVAHVVDRAEISGADSEKDDTTLIAEAEKQLEELLDSLDIGYCEKVVIVGETVPAILNLIQNQKADLVVMGTHTKDKPPAWVKSITLEVVSNTECDVLVLHK